MVIQAFSATNEIFFKASKNALEGFYFFLAISHNRKKGRLFLLYSSLVSLDRRQNPLPNTYQCNSPYGIAFD